MEASLDRYLDAPETLDARALEDLGALGRRDLVTEAKRRIDELVRSDPPGALPIADLLGHVADGDPDVAVVVQRGRATAFHANGRSKDALVAYLEALEVYRRQGNELEAARVLRSLVDVYQLAGQPQRSLERAEEAREILERLGEERLLAQLETNVGNVYVRLDDYPTARASYLSACARLERARLPLDLAISRYNLALVESQSGMFTDAERTFEAARSIFATEGMQVHVADCLYMLSLVQARRGSFADAIAGLEEARRMYAVHRKPQGIPACDLDLAEIYLRLDARREAATHAGRAATGFSELELDYERAKAETIQGVASLRQNDVDSAALAFADARETFAHQENRAWAAIVDVHRSEIDLLRGEAERASERLRSARRTLDDMELALWSDLAAVALARALVAAERVDEAEEVLGSLVTGRNQSHALDAIVLGQAWRALAELRHRSDDVAGATAALESAVAATEGVLGELPRADIRIAFFRSPHAAYVDLAYLRAKEDADSSLELLESGRFRSWNPIDPNGNEGSPSLSSARERLAWFLASRLDADVGAAGGEEELGGPGADDAKLREAATDVARLSASPRDDRLRLEALREAIGPDETAVAYALSSYGAVAYVLTATTLEVVDLAIASAELERLRRRWFFHVGKLRLGDEYSRRHGARLAESANVILDAFGKRLISPLIDRIRTRSLVIVPYGPLHGLPFHAFRHGGRFIADDFDVTYGLSLGHVASCRRRTSASGEVHVCEAQVDDLPALREEVAHVTGAYGAATHAIATHELHGFLSATRPEGGLLHLASHGAFRADNPVLSALLLGDTMLTVRELSRMNLGFDLVTLSGCETGRPQVSGGEEAFGVAHSFLRGGARAVVCSLWPVHDHDSATFMAGFYERLASGQDARASLAASQLAARESERGVASWSSFILLGAPDVCVPAER